MKSQETDALLDLRERVEEILEQRGRLIVRQLQALDRRRIAERRGLEPKYRSRTDPNKIWSGRGVIPRWMREEMAGTDLTKEDFLIERR